MTQIGNAQSSSDDEVDGEQITYVTGNTGLGQSNCDGKGLTTPQDEMGSGFQLTLVPGYDDDPKRKPKEFAPRQVQMMGLGIMSRRSKAEDSRLRNRDWSAAPLWNRPVL
jgi:hypothetical protein